MTKITIPIIAAKNGGNLYTLVDDLANTNSAVTRVQDESGDNLLISDELAGAGQKLKIKESTILEILSNGGEIEGYLFGIKQPIASANLGVPEGVPSRLFILGAVRDFSQWFGGNAEVWSNNVTNEFMYYNSPNPSDGLILKASEAEIIRQLDTNTYSFLTIAEVQVLITDTDWVKL